jgi:hypothetical protein
MHVFQPTPADAKTLATEKSANPCADLFALLQGEVAFIA